MFPPPPAPPRPRDCEADYRDVAEVLEGIDSHDALPPCGAWGGPARAETRPIIARNRESARLLATGGVRCAALSCRRPAAAPHHRTPPPARASPPAAACQTAPPPRRRPPSPA